MPFAKSDLVSLKALICFGVEPMSHRNRKEQETGQHSLTAPDSHYVQDILYRLAKHMAAKPSSRTVNHPRQIMVTVVELITVIVSLISQHIMLEMFPTDTQTN